jgi:hypothetical protein
VRVNSTHILFVVALGIVFTSVKAEAQYVPPPQPISTQSLDTSHAPSLNVPQAIPQNRGAMPQNRAAAMQNRSATMQQGAAASAYPNGQPAAAPNTEPILSEDEAALFDSGLWDGAPVGPCCAICGGGSGCPPDWYVDTGVRLLTRSRPRGIAMGYQLTFGSAGTLTSAMETLSSRSPGPNISTAGALMIGHYFARDIFNNDHFVELSFWGFNSWKDRAEFYGNNNLYSQYFVSGFEKTGTFTKADWFDGFEEARYQSVHYESYNNNFELNGRIVPRGRDDQLILHPNGKWRRECQPGMYFSYLYGLRFMQIEEAFGFHSESLIHGMFSTGDYEVATHNNMLGLQIGADMTFRNCRWNWGVRSKLGPYVNFSDQVSNINVEAGSVSEFDRRLSESAIKMAFIGEMGFFANYKFRPNVMGRVGYDFMWVTGLALAPEQVQFTKYPINKVNTNGTTFFQGISLGMEWTW